MIDHYEQVLITKGRLRELLQMEKDYTVLRAKLEEVSQEMEDLEHLTKALQDVMAGRVYPIEEIRMRFAHPSETE